MSTITSIQSDFERRFADSWPVAGWRDCHVILAVSGGADSVAMLRAAAAVKGAVGGDGRLFVAHLNHGFRGSESDGDEAWVKALCGRLELPMDAAKVDVTALASQQGDGFEAAARTARYDFLQRVAERVGARFVTTAHTADDQAETVLHRILRGTGLAGLAGIPAARQLSKSVALVRPLRGVSRREVLEYLTAIGQDHRTDSSNANTQWMRNRLRTELLPLLRERYNSGVNDALLNLATQAGEAQELLARHATELVGRCVNVEFDSTPASNGEGDSNRRLATRVRIDCRQIERELPIVVREVCKLAWTEANWPHQSMGFDEWQQLAAIVVPTGKSRTLNLPGKVRTRREEDILHCEVVG